MALTKKSIAEIKMGNYFQNHLFYYFRPNYWRTPKENFEKIIAKKIRPTPGRVGFHCCLAALCLFGRGKFAFGMGVYLVAPQEQ